MLIHTYLSKCLVYSIFIPLAIATTSCDCKNSNKNLPNSNKSNQRIPNPNNNNKHNPPPPNGNRADKVAKAIQKLEEELKKPDADPKLQEIYNVIKLLPPREFVRNSDGSLSRTSKEKDGIELFDKIIQNAGLGIGSFSETVAWLIDQQLLDPKEADQQGIPLLEKVLAVCVNKDHALDEALTDLAAIIQNLTDKGATFPTEKATVLLKKFIEERFIQADPESWHLKAFNFLKAQGATLPPDKASTLLEKLLKKQLTNTESPEELLEIIKFLEAQGATIPSETALDLLEKFIQKGASPQGLFAFNKDKNKLILYKHILDLLEKYTQGVTIDKNKASDLLQKAVNKELGAKLYITLLDLGADPNNVRVKYLNEPIPLSHYAAKNSYDNDFKILLKKLIDNPQIDINITNKENLTLGMVDAYNRYSTATINALLERPDLDINTLKDHRAGAEDYTLLDMVTANCMEIPTGHNWQQEEILERSKRWLAILKKMSNHTNFYVTDDNIQKAERSFQTLNNYFENENIRQAKSIAKEALELLENS